MLRVFPSTRLAAISPLRRQVVRLVFTRGGIKQEYRVYPGFQWMGWAVRMTAL